MSKQAVSGSGGLKAAAVAWHQLPAHKKKHYQLKVDKASQESTSDLS